MTLSNQSPLSHKMHKYTGGTIEGYEREKKILVTDGAGYTIEWSIEGRYGVYEFDNPDAYSKFCADVSELKDYLNIVETFRKCLQRR